MIENKKSVNPTQVDPPASNIPPFRTFLKDCVKHVLPNVISNDISLVELYDRVLYELNQLIQDTNTLKEIVSNWTNWTEEQFQYFYEWFENLDVSQEIKDKLDEMVADGTFGEIIREVAYVNSSPKFVDTVSQMTDQSQIYVLSSNGHIYYYNGTTFIDSGLVYGADLTSYLGYKSNLISTDDCNNLTLNGWYFSNDTNNLPANWFSPNRGGILFNIFQNQNRVYQYGFDMNYNMFYHRNNVNGNWTPWEDRFTFQAYGTLPSGDLNDVNLNGAYFLTSANNYTNSPIAGGMLLNIIDYTIIPQSRVFQIAINTPNQAVWVRNKTSNTVWSAWGEISQFNYRGTLASMSLNDVTSPGFYFLSSANTYTDSAVAAGLLLDFNENYGSVSSRHYQFEYDYSTGALWLRNRMSPTVWSEWRALGGGSGGELTQNSYTWNGTNLAFTSKNYTFNFKNFINANNNLNVWGLGAVAYKGTVFNAEGNDITGPILEINGTDFIGGLHGNEIGTKTIVKIDGQEFNLSSASSTGEFDELDIYVESELYSTVTGNHCINRFVHITMLYGVVTIRNRMEFVESFNCRTATSGGLISVFDDLYNGFTSDSDFKFYDVPTGNTLEELYRTSDRKSFSYMGNGFCLTIKNVKCVPDTNYSSVITHFGADSRPRTKIYLQNVYLAGGQLFNPGDVIMSSFDIELN